MGALAHNSNIGSYSHHYPSTNFGGGFYMMYFWIIGLALLVYFIYMMGRKQSEPKQEENPINILKRRFAEGELSESEYDSALEKLKN